MFLFFCFSFFPKKCLQGKKKLFSYIKSCTFSCLLLLFYYHFGIFASMVQVIFKYFMYICTQRKNIPLFSITSIILFNLKEKKIIIKVSVKENIYTWIFRQENIPNNISRLKKFTKQFFFVFGYAKQFLQMAEMKQKLSIGRFEFNFYFL